MPRPPETPGSAGWAAGAAKQLRDTFRGHQLGICGGVTLAVLIPASLLPGIWGPASLLAAILLGLILLGIALFTDSHDRGLKGAFGLIALVIGISQGPQSIEYIAHQISKGLDSPACELPDPNRTTDMRSVSRESTATLDFLDTVTYRLERGEGDQLYVTARGTTNGDVPGRHTLYLIETADVGSTDQTGYTVHKIRYYPKQRLNTGCWTLRRQIIGHARACGLAFRFFVALTPDKAAAEFDQYVDEHTIEYDRDNAGFGVDYMQRNMSVTPLAYWLMPTKGKC
jgi:hypothetical protein